MERSVSMSSYLKLPVGIDDFKKIRVGNFFYMDKTQWIEQIIENWCEVSLFTRPRRFGKTLNMSMLRYFFEIGTDISLFDGLYIQNNKELCDAYMGKYPVIFISLKDVEGLNYAQAKYSLIEKIVQEARRFSFLLDSCHLSQDEKAHYKAMIAQDKGEFTMSDKLLPSALFVLSELLYKHYHKKVIILIDEYDVPLDKAFQHGYYEEMVSLIRSLFSQALKSNEYLQFAILTGCLRISKESIFTGMNNFKVLSITDTRFDEQFGFTQKEVQELLESYHLESHLNEMKEWYDGYRFGNADIYCPWDVINHVDRLKSESNALPQSYWINTSGNDLVKRFINKANKTTRDEIERLIAGESIEKKIRLELTYDEVDQSIENLWSVLFTTGYLTQVGQVDENVYKLVIPNREVKEVYKAQIQEWFKQKIMNNTQQLIEFWKALEEGDSKQVENYLNKTLSNSISVLDNHTKENSYHNLLVGLLVGNEEWLVKSNVEAGEGYADIIVETEDVDSGLVLELKYCKDVREMEQACVKAMNQIQEKQYANYLINEGRNQILLIAIAFYKKRCKVIVEKLNQTL